MFTHMVTKSISDAPQRHGQSASPALGIGIESAVRIPDLWTVKWNQERLRCAKFVISESVHSGGKTHVIHFPYLERSGNPVGRVPTCWLTAWRRRALAPEAHDDGRDGHRPFLDYL